MLSRLLFWFIILVNLGGAAFGLIFYYGEQLANTNPLLWIFVPDFSLYALLFAVVFYFQGEPKPRELKKWFGRVPDLSWLWFLIFVGALKYGFLTVFVLSAYSPFFFTPEAGLMLGVLFGFNIFLMFETILLVGKIRIREVFLLISLVWFLINDFSDYLLGTHIQLPESALVFMFPATMGMSVVFTLMAYLVLGRYARDTYKV
jgi:uncharacterized membrane protein YpjA